MDSKLIKLTDGNLSVRALIYFPLSQFSRVGINNLFQKTIALFKQIILNFTHFHSQFTPYNRIITLKTFLLPQWPSYLTLNHQNHQITYLKTPPLLQNPSISILPNGLSESIQTFHLICLSLINPQCHSTSRRYYL